MSKRGKPHTRQAQRTVTVVRPGRRGPYWGTTIGVAVVVLFAAAVGIGLYVTQQPTQATTPPNTTAQGVVAGRPDAPVTIDLYEDFQCPACQRFEQSVGPTIDQLVAAGRSGCPGRRPG